VERGCISVILWAKVGPTLEKNPVGGYLYIFNTLATESLFSLDISQKAFQIALECNIFLLKRLSILTYLIKTLFSLCGSEISFQLASKCTIYLLFLNGHRDIDLAIFLSLDLRFQN